MFVYELIERLQQLPATAKIELWYDCNFGRRNVASVALRQDPDNEDEFVVALSEDEYESGE